MTFLSTLCHSRWAVWLCFDCRTPGFWAKYSPALQSGASTRSICSSADRFQESIWMVKRSATEQTEQRRSSIDRCSRWLSKSSGAIDPCTQEAPLQADSFTWATQKTGDRLDHKDIRRTWKRKEKRTLLHWWNKTIFIAWYSVDTSVLKSSERNKKPRHFATICILLCALVSTLLLCK